MTIVLPVIPANAAAPTVIYKTDFEGGGDFIVDWEQFGWSRGEYAQGHGDDVWCRGKGAEIAQISKFAGVSVTAHSGRSALWCARMGTNSQNGIENIVNGYPDQGMDSWVRMTPPNASKYDGMTLSFWYWSKTETNSYTGTLTDYLQVNINDGSKTVWGIWKQPSPDSQGWQLATIELPKGTVWMEWEFKTGPTVPPGGPYPGALIDDVTITTDASTGPPVSTVASLNTLYNGRTIQVPFTVANSGSGLDYVELYYRVDNGQWTHYASASTPTGHFTGSPITFVAPSDGHYDFYTTAVDSSGAIEATKVVPDSSTVIDTAAPVTSIVTNGSSSANGWYTSNVTVQLNATDPLSGVNETDYRVDGGTWTVYRNAFLVSGDGQHKVEFRSTDKAGNVETVKNAQVNIDTRAPDVQFTTANGTVFTSSPAIIAWNVTDDASNISKVEVSVDGQPFSTLAGVTNSFTVNNATNGEHDLLVRVTDKAGNAVENRINFKVDVSSQTLPGSQPSDTSMPVGTVAIALALVGIAVIGAVLVVVRRRNK